MRKTIAMILTVSLMAVLLTGCKEAEKDTEIVFTTEFEENEIFRIDQSSCYLPELMVYMYTSKDQYETVFGNEIWGKDIGGNTLEGQIKDTILARAAQIKVMNLLAAQYNLTLSEEQSANASKAAKEYISSLSDKEIKYLGIDEDLVKKMYSEYALANDVYNEITKDVNPEISDDEARTITVKAILVKTYSLDSKGEKIEYTDSQKNGAVKKIHEAKRLIDSGEDFDKVAEKYNEAEETEYSFGKGTMPEKFEEVAFDLDTDAVSNVVTTDYGYHLIKCVSTFDREQTDANKEKIVQQRKKEAFKEVYDSFVKTLYSNIDQEAWDAIEFEANADITTTNFYDIYNEIFL